MGKVSFIKTGLIVILGLFILGGLTVGALFASIPISTHNYSAMAQKAHPHPEDNVLSLIDFINSKSHSLHDRNQVVWALGRLSDPRALPALQSFYTGKKCNHNAYLCQYELEKAIKRCGGMIEVKGASYYK